MERTIISWFIAKRIALRAFEDFNKTEAFNHIIGEHPLINVNGMNTDVLTITSLNVLL